MKPSQQKAIIQNLVIQEMNKQKEEIRLQVVRAMTAALLLVLHDKWEWKSDDLVKVMDQVFAQFDLVCDKYVTVEDFYKELESMGIEIVDGKEG